MSTPANHWKLGLFVVVSVLLGLGALVMLGAEALRKETITYVSFFDEAVSGLGVGSPVSFRGVTIGNVSSIDVAPDRRHVSVSYEMGVQELTRLGLAQKTGRRVRISVPRDVRVQLASTGITGVKYVKLDFFDPTRHPAPKLPFDVPESYIPATPSTMKNIEDTLLSAIDRVPEVMNHATAVLAEFRALAISFNRAGIPEKASLTLDQAQHLVANLDQKVDTVDAAGMSRDAHEAIKKLNEALIKVDGVLARVEGDNGLLDSVQRASDSIGDVASNARGTGDDLDKTLRDLSEASRSVQQLVDALEVEPDMLIKGRTSP
jgi:phospholipid/cholesterol/gamma-HCH transport system substrate-binding protein